MFARLLLGGALGMALVTLSASANAQSNGRVDYTDSDRIGSHFNAVSDERGNGPLLTFSKKNPSDRDDEHDDDDPGHHRHRSHHHDD